MSSSHHLENLIVLNLLLRRYSYPRESRFVNFFGRKSRLPKRNNAKTREKSLVIEPVNILNGVDKRTAIILKNLPDDICKEDLKSIIGPLGSINFIYIPLLIKNKNNHSLPCSYINVINYKTIIKIKEKFEQIKIFNPTYNNKDLSKVDIFYSGTQGKYALINRFSYEQKYLPPKQTISFS